MDKVNCTQRLISELCKKDCKRSFKCCALSFWGILALAITYSAIAIFGFIGARADLTTKLSTPSFIIELALVFAVIVTSLSLSKLYITPQETIKPIHKGLSLTFFAMVSILSLSTMETSHLVWAENLNNIHCVAHIALFALPATIATLWLAKKQAPTFPNWLAAHIVLAYTALGYFAVRLVCTQENVPHHACTHILPVIVYAALGYLIGRKVLNWS